MRLSTVENSLPAAGGARQVGDCGRASVSVGCLVHRSHCR